MKHPSKDAFRDISERLIFMVVSLMGFAAGLPKERLFEIVGTGAIGEFGRTAFGDEFALADESHPVANYAPRPSSAS